MYFRVYEVALTHFLHVFRVSWVLCEYSKKVNHFEMHEELSDLSLRLFWQSHGSLDLESGNTERALGVVLEGQRFRWSCST